MIKKIVGFAFVALIIAMVIPSSRATLREDVFTPIVDNINGRLVLRRLNAMADQLEFRLGRAQGFPGNFGGWLCRDFKGAPEDPWGNVYYLRIRRRDFTVGSAGGDGEPRTLDDITVTRPLAAGR